MKLTGKCKEDFEEWVGNQPYSISHDVGERQMNIVPLADMIEQLPKSMQYGVLVDFFDSVGVEIDIDIDSKFRYEVAEINFYIYTELQTYDGYDNHYSTRQEARTKAIEKANEIYNKTYLLKQITKPNVNVL
jgi:hypothetical protein